MNMNQIGKYGIITLCLMISPLLTADPAAETSEAPTTAGSQTANVKSATVFLKDVADRLIAKLDADHDAINSDLSNAVKIVDNIIMPATDFELIGKRVLGPHWRTASDAQRQAFLKEFKLLLIITYAAAFRTYKDQTVEFTNEMADPSDPSRVEVRTKIHQPGAAPIPVNYRLVLENGAWKVYDFNVDGVGLTSNFRSQFNNAINQKGIDAVIAEMKKKNVEVFK